MSLVEQVMRKRLHNHIKEENSQLELFEYVEQRMTWDEWQAWIPTEDDIPSIVESIKYWGMIGHPKKPRNQWSPIEREIYLECRKKEMICYELLGRVDDSWWKKSKK